MDIIEDYKQLRMIEALKEYKKMEVAYKENLKLCKWQEQHISKLADIILKIQKIAEEICKEKVHVPDIDKILGIIKESEV